MKNEPRTFAIGDIHGDFTGLNVILKFLTSNNKTTKDDVLIVAGDCGFVWTDSQGERKKRKHLDSFPITIMVVLGNHENYDIIETFETVYKFGAECYKDNESEICYVKNGEVLEIGNKRIWTYGGGLSIDKDYRLYYDKIENTKTWFEQEVDFSRFDKAKENFKNIDFIVTHDVPTSCFEYLLKKLKLLEMRCEMQNKLEEIKQLGGYKKWYSGHYHPKMIEEWENHIILPVLCWTEIKE